MGYVILFLIGLPLGYIFRMLFIRVIVSAGWWLIGAVFFALCVIYGMIPEKIRSALKALLTFAVIGFFISCLF